MPKGLKHTEETKSKISEAAIRTMKQSNAGFRQRVSCDLCGQSMSPANLGKHYNRCKETRGMFLNGLQLSVFDIKKLRKRLRPIQWTVEAYIAAHNEQQGLCALCNKPPLRDRLSADHCHNSNTPRKLLCEQCNFGLGIFKDDVDILNRAIEYINSYKD